MPNISKNQDFLKSTLIEILDAVNSADTGKFNQSGNWVKQPDGKIDFKTSEMDAALAKLGVNTGYWRKRLGAVATALMYLNTVDGNALDQKVDIKKAKAYLHKISEKQLQSDFARALHASALLLTSQPINQLDASETGKELAGLATFLGNLAVFKDMGYSQKNPNERKAVELAETGVRNFLGLNKASFFDRLLNNLFLGLNNNNSPRHRFLLPRPPVRKKIRPPLNHPPQKLIPEKDLRELEKILGNSKLKA